MLYTFRSLHIHHSYYLSFSYCLSTKWLSLSRNPLPRSEFKFPHGYSTTVSLWTILGLPGLSFVRYGLGFRLSHYTGTPMGYDQYTCFITLYGLCVMPSSFFIILILPLFFTMLIEVHLSLALPAFLSPPAKYQTNA